jgi:hypothetical protein
MHSIRKYNSAPGGWVTVLYFGTNSVRDIQLFTSRDDAMALAAYLNGGGDLKLSMPGYKELEAGADA